MTPESGTISGSRIINQYSGDAYLPSLGIDHIKRFDLTPLALAVFPVTCLNTIPNRFQVIQTHPPLQSLICNRSTTTSWSTIKRAKNPWCTNSLKLPFSRKDRPQGYLAAGTEDFNLFLRPISKYYRQIQSFPETVTQMFKCDISIDLRTRITVVGDKCFTNTPQD